MSKKVNSEDLNHKQICEFIRNSFREIKDATNINAIIHFHSVNKFLLMAHNPNYARILGNIIANHDDLPLSIVLEKYGETLEIALKNEPTTKSHSNVLQKISGYFKKDMTMEEKLILRKIIEDYRLGKTSLNNVLLLLDDLTRRFQKTYLVRQTYFLLYVTVSNPKQTSVK
ncbi:MAG: DUF1722 domain-containing protein [Thaumarchaeota archaeon]|nr:DUF1722 domain-containing protein [Nitrososphaerota archaeon]